jgi:thiol:disulfide interchange protein
METFKQIMGFVLLGTVVFIFTFISWPLLVPTLTLLFGIWLACWYIGRISGTAELPEKLIKWGVSLAAAGVVGVIAFWWLADITSTRYTSALDRAAGERVAGVAETGRKLKQPDDATELPWRPFTAEELDRLARENKTVLVDFTADWCVLCKSLETWVLNTKPVRELVDENDVETLVADWSSRDPELGRLLEALGSKQVPVLAIFPAGKPNEPIVIVGGYTRAQLLKRLREAGPSQSAVVATAGSPTTSGEKSKSAVARTDP